MKTSRRLPKRSLCRAGCTASRTECELAAGLSSYRAGPSRLSFSPWLDSSSAGCISCARGCEAEPAASLQSADRLFPAARGASLADLSSTADQFQTNSNCVFVSIFISVESFLVGFSFSQTSRHQAAEKERLLAFLMLLESVSVCFMSTVFSVCRRSLFFLLSVHV
jgi:hypothetical protein